MIDFFISDPLEMQPDDEFTVVDDFRVGDIAYFVRVSPHKFHLRMVQEDKVGSVKEPKYRVGRGRESGTIAFMSYDPQESRALNEGSNAMSETEQDKVSNHLEFLGYAVERDGKHLSAKHPSKSNLFVRFYDKGIVLSTYYICTDTAKQTRQRLLEYVNSLNSNALAVRFFLDNDQDVNLVSFSPGDYDKLAFGRFLQYWENDFSQMATLPETGQFLK